jgi:predicted RNA binding protein YcfA (HicA-like mRNA interferase family)
MPKLPRLSGEEAIRALERLGFRRARQQGSHVVMRKDTPHGVFGCVVPLHRQLAIGTLHGILKQARVEAQDFIDLL